MKKLVSVALSCLLVAVVGFAAAGDAPAKFSKGLLWKIEKTTIQPSYVFGTIHLDDARVPDLPAPVKETFARSRSFTMEMIIDEASAQKFATSMLLDEGGDLKTLLGEPLFAKTTEVMREYGMPG